MIETASFTIGDIALGGRTPLVLVSGPCQLETLDHARAMAHGIAEASDAAGLRFIFKASYDKANRTAATSARGPGLDEGLAILARIKAEFGCPVLTDVHLPADCAAVAEVCDVLQIPAFLCRQTDLLIAAGKTGRAVNIKKGQFLAPWDMVHACDKVSATGNRRIVVCERGTSFGYNTLVNDFRALPILARTGFPVMFDATHSVQQPGGEGARSGGERAYIPVLARAAVAVGVSALFLETHQEPARAPSDGASMLPLADLRALLTRLAPLDALVKDWPQTEL